MIDVVKKTDATSCHGNVSKEENVFSFLVVLMVLFHVYHPSSIPISYGELLIALCIPLFFKRGMKLPLGKQELGFIVYFFYMMVSSLILGIVFDAPMSKYFSIARAGFYWIIIFYFGLNLFNRMVFERWMIYFSVALSFFIFIQLAVYLSTGFYISGLFLSLPINNGAESGLATYQHTLQMADWQGFIRPHGFLAEPSHVSQYLFISLISLICGGAFEFKKKLLLIISFSAAIVVTQSTTGIVLLMFAWLLFFFTEKNFSVCRFPLTIVFIAVCVYILFSGDGSNISSIERVINIINGSEIDTSSEVRLNNGVKVFANLPVVFQIFGTGEGLFEYVVNFFAFGEIQNYMNSFFRILFNTGVIGLLIWMVSLAILFIMSGIFGKSLVVGFFIMSLGCSIYCQPQMVWFFLLILADIRGQNDRYSRIKL